MGLEKRVRVRFAPSPTGPLHIGGVRTALYNYLFARKHGGDFLLRIEDTDQTRFVKGAEEYIIESFKWLGLDFDEGVGIGGEYGPYRQSERKSIYREYADRLIENGWAYYAFDSPEELDSIRKEYEKRKGTFQYDSSTRGGLKNSLTLSEEETNKLIEEEHPYVIRFKFPENKEIELFDLIRGEVRMNSSLLDDKVLFKSDGMPTYHLANVVDDYSMKISHVIRGEEWLPSTPLHTMLYKAFGWEDFMPEFAHLPLILKPDGNGKLSKRDGDRLGFPVFPIDWVDADSKELSSGYREAGYLPEAVINMLALLGWNPGNNEEIFSLEELIQEFSIERVNKSGAKFDIEKAKWFNYQYVQSIDESKIIDGFLEILKEKNLNQDRVYATKVVTLIKERAGFVSELWDQGYFFYESPKEYDENIIKKRWKEGMGGWILSIADILEGLDDFVQENIDSLISSYIKDNSLNMGQVMNSLRLCMVGEGKGPSLSDIMVLVGKEETVERLRKGVETIEA